MKKITVIMLVSALFLMLSAPAAFAGGVVKVGIEPSGTFSTEFFGLTLSNDVEMGISIAGEYLLEISDTLAAGGGIEYQLSRKERNAESGFNYIPLYGLIRYNVPNTAFFLTGKVGYNLFFVEDPVEEVNYNGGLFYGAGGGMVFLEKFQ